jgi:hypothetical protein
VRRLYAETMGRRSLPPGVYFRLLLIGYFEGIDSERGIAWRAADSFALRDFLGLDLHDAPPDHSTISRTRRLIAVETHRAVFTWVAQCLGHAGLIKGKTIGSTPQRLKRTPPCAASYGGTRRGLRAVSDPAGETIVVDGSVVLVFLSGSKEDGVYEIVGSFAGAFEVTQGIARALMTDAEIVLGEFKEKPYSEFVSDAHLPDSGRDEDPLHRPVLVLRDAGSPLLVVAYGHTFDELPRALGGSSDVPHRNTS